MPREYFYSDTAASNFTPNCINNELTVAFGMNLHPQVVAAINELNSKGWRFFVVTQNRGRAYYRHKVITIPDWAYKRQATGNPGYLDWYVSHECAHAYRAEANDWAANHGDSFMEELVRICPDSSLKYELNYKPRNAIRNGITADGYVIPQHKIRLEDL